MTARTLSAIPFFAGLEERLAVRHAARALWLTAEPGESILSFEDRSQDVFFILSGSVRVLVRTAGGRELILHDITAGGFFGEMSAIDAAPRSACVTALHRSRICRMRGDQFMALLEAAPHLARRLMSVLAERVRQSNARMLELTSLDIPHRLHAELLRMAGPPEASGERAISPPPVQQVLASRIGARREAVSREVARLLREGILQRRRGALVIQAPQRLEQELAAILER